MSKRSMSKKVERNLRLVFHPRRGVRLSVSKSRLTIRFTDKHDNLKKYVEAMINHFGIEPLFTDIVTVNEPSLLPPNAPIDSLTEKLSVLAASFGNLRLVQENDKAELAWSVTPDIKVQNARDDLQ